jgi:predicted nucleic acid-binding Zn ribbon protein
MSRREPIRLADALARVVGDAQPNTPLAAVQAVWAEAVGPAIAGWATPAQERNGVVTVHCDDSVTAHQLNSMQLEIIEKLRAVGVAAPITEIRFRVGEQG